MMSGCGPENQAVEPAGEPTLVATEQALSEYEFTWSQGELPKYLGAAGSQFCFLTRMTGRFRGGGEYIYTSTVKNAWFLEGSSLQEEVAASARCAYVPDNIASGEYIWDSTRGSPTSMGGASGRVCVLTFISGNFDSADAWVRLYVNNGHWFLDGAKNKQLEARARCIGGLRFSTVEYSWSQDDGQSTLLGWVPGLACGFTYVQGNFQGGGETVQIYPSAGDWYLGGASQQTGVAAKARCFPEEWTSSFETNLQHGG